MEGVRLVKVLIKAGAEIDVPTRAEVAEDIDKAWRGYMADHQLARARGTKFIRLSGIGPVPAAQTLYLANGPEVGYIWALRLLSVQLAAADTVLAYVTSSAPSAGSTPQRLIANMSTSNANQVSLFATAQAMIYGGESVYLSAAAHNIVAWHLAAWEVPSEMEYKLL
jgi:hypothetical protein